MTKEERKEVERTILARERRQMDPLKLGLQAVIESHHGKELVFQQSTAHVSFILALAQFFSDDAMNEEAHEFLDVLNENEDAIRNDPARILGLFCDTVYARMLAVEKERRENWLDNEERRKQGWYTSKNDDTGRRR